MRDFRARISRVRMKEGASVTILPGGRQPDAESVHGLLRRYASQISDMDGPGSALDGFIVIGIFSDGMTSVGYDLPTRIPRALAVPYLSEVMRRDIIMDAEAERVFDDKFQWVE